jgi:hypothetical protein
MEGYGGVRGLLHVVRFNVFACRRLGCGWRTCEGGVLGGRYEERSLVYVISSILHYTWYPDLESSFRLSLLQLHMPLQFPRSDNCQLYSPRCFVYFDLKYAVPEILFCSIRKP